MAEAKVKAYVEVTASFDQEGRLWPQEIIWEDGRRYTIDKVVELRQAASLKAGGQGDRYTIRVGGRETYLSAVNLPAATWVAGSWSEGRANDGQGN